VLVIMHASESHSGWRGRSYAQDEVGVVRVEMTHAMVMPVHNGRLVCHDDIHQRLEIGLVGCGRAVRVVQLEEFPLGSGVGEG